MLVEDKMVLLRRGAEANIYLASFMGFKVVVKRRGSKSYRIREVDCKVREYRTMHEARLLSEVKKFGVPTPAIYFVDRENFDIIMEYVEGVRLKDYLQNTKEIDALKEACFKFGYLIGKLHKNGIIHGDLTTSNVILTEKMKMFLIDFGLGFYSDDVETQGVDLHLLKQVFESFHHNIAAESFKAVLSGYGKVVGNRKREIIEKKLKEIKSRGRYIPAEERYQYT
ncbi:MAG: KEOPS complex kinase/ATPase Bud32 [Candidatus Bathyarchaeota archaeon]|nr:KEOPS complex kinase/ATPase Bud32 [Candidatus Bathyarchaeota archaeon]